MKSVELFTGAGGLALGVARAGFSHELLIERDRYACETIQENRARGVEPVRDWRVLSQDVTKIRSFADLVSSEVDLLAGGPPCQPFSMGGKHGGFLDKRDMFPQFIRAVRDLRPKAILVENVKGLAREAFADYLRYIVQQLRHPDERAHENEQWTDHLRRLDRVSRCGSAGDLRYRIQQPAILNAADYGVPQRRHRIFIVGFREDLDLTWEYPARTHSQAQLLWEQWGTGAYWDRHKVAAKDRPEPPARLNGRHGLSKTFVRPWRTVRDAFAEPKRLPDPETYIRPNGFLNHQFMPGARAYHGHTGSPIDEPAKTLKAGDHGVPGGENVVVFPNGKRRYFTVRESARLQTFPDEFVFHGSWTETMRQLGNAVPVDLAEVMARQVRRQLAPS